MRESRIEPSSHHWPLFHFWRIRQCISRNEIISGRDFGNIYPPLVGKIPIQSPYRMGQWGGAPRGASCWPKAAHTGAPPWTMAQSTSVKASEAERKGTHRNAEKEDAPPGTDGPSLTSGTAGALLGLGTPGPVDASSQPKDAS